MSLTVAVIGASTNPSRYSHRAMLLLQEHGHITYPVHPLHTEITGRPAFASIAHLPTPIDTVTLYVGPAHSSALAAPLIALKPRRVIFNPGSENPALENALSSAGICVELACTLVLLRTHQF